MLKTDFTEQVREDRTIHLLDVENLLGGPVFTAAQVSLLEHAYASIAGVRDSDQFILATSHFAAEPTWFGWGRPCRRLVRSGVDGADLALIDVMTEEGLADRFAHVMLGSGDGIFAEPCARLQSMGSQLTVVSRERLALSRKLAFAVRDVRFLESERLDASMSLRAVA